MKAFLVSIAALFFAFFLGCQSSITDPVVPESNMLGTSEQQNIFSKDLFTFIYPNVITIEGLLYDPSHKLNRNTVISGVLRYGIQKIKGNVFSHYGTPPDKNYKVSIYVDAELKGGCENSKNPWIVKGTAEYIVQANSTEQAVYSFVKSFRVANTCCKPINLVFELQFGNQQLVLASTSLKLANGLYPNRDQ